MEGDNLITLNDIEKGIEKLNNIWIIPKDERKRWGNRHIWQSTIPFKQSQYNLLPIINGLENVSDMTIIDVGCEAGIWSVALSQKFKKVIALDLDEPSIKRTYQTLEVFTDMGFDVSNISIEHKEFQQTYKHDFKDIDGLFIIDGYFNDFSFFSTHKPLVNHINFLFWSYRENFSVPIEDRLEEINNIKNTFKEYNFEPNLYSTVDYNRTGDLFVGIK